MRITTKRFIVILAPVHCERKTKSKPNINTMGENMSQLFLIDNNNNIINNNIIFVDARLHETTNTARIKYEKETDELLWYRIVSGGIAALWQHVPASAMREGEFSSPTLTPGQIYDVRIFRETRDPNNVDAGGDARPEAHIRIYCLLKTEKRNFISDFEQDVGGTYIRAYVHTDRKTYTQLVVSDEPPTRDAEDFPSFNTVIGSVEDVNSLTSHTLEQKPLLPGNVYFAFVMATDSYGNWDVRDIIFTTKKRKITIRFKKLIIDNDGDSGPFGGDSGEGNFVFYIAEGAEENHRWAQIVKDFRYDNDHYVDHEKIDLPLAFVHVLGPEKVYPLNLNVGVYVLGYDIEGPLEADVRAQSEYSELYLPTGYQAEELIDRQKFVQARPAGGDYFHCPCYLFS
jgi:hypothetical protein